MSKPIQRIFARLGLSVAAGAILIAGSMTTAVADDAYTPTMKDMRSIQNALERYLKGFDTHDAKLQATAFWDDAMIIEPTGGKVSVKEMLAMAAGPTGGAPPAQAGAGAGAPPPGGAPPAGPPKVPPSCDAKAGMPAKGWDMWHIVANDSYEFQSPTRVRHHAYWFAVCPGAGPTNGIGLAVIGPPGHYDDILEKRNGEWRLISRSIGLAEKYPKN